MPCRVSVNHTAQETAATNQGLKGLLLTFLFWAAWTQQHAPKQCMCCRICAQVQFVLASELCPCRAHLKSRHMVIPSA